MCTFLYISFISSISYPVLEDERPTMKKVEKNISKLKMSDNQQKANTNMYVKKD